MTLNADDLLVLERLTSAIEELTAAVLGMRLSLRSASHRKLRFEFEDAAKQNSEKKITADQIASLYELPTYLLPHTEHGLCPVCENKIGEHADCVDALIARRDEAFEKLERVRDERDTALGTLRRYGLA